jgi:tetratricopeptide (TPR) repeat protein
MNAEISLDTRQWVRLRDAFSAAVASTDEQQRASIDALNSADPELGRMLADLLEAHRLAADHTEEARERWLQEAAATLDGTAVGQRIGGFELREVLGRGGMGVVYRAERVDGHVRQQVAMKFLRLGRTDPQDLRRFRVERDLAATLRHPGIAGLLDAGETPSGTPYYAMELIEGQPISAWCSTRRLGLHDRLRLFVAVCDAVAHAHSKLILHRDIKPSNVLVTAEGQPKLIDFGIAKSLQSQEPTIDATATAHRAFTMGYAAPEQLKGLPLSTACDVYQLGALLYELLAGQAAFPVEGRSYLELERLILEVDPRPPSRARTDRGVTGESIPGDLDSVVLRALRKRPEDRYASVAALADDVSAWLDGRPVTAGDGQRWYRLRRFCRRHVLAIGVAAIVLATLSGSAGMLWRQSEAVRIERDMAARAADRAEEVTRFLLRVFESAEPGAALPADTPVSEVVDQAAQRLSNELAGQPEVKAAMLDALARVNLSLERFPEAKSLLEQSASALPPDRIADVRQAIEHYTLQAQLLEQSDDPARTQAAAERAIALHEQVGDPPGRRVRAWRVANTLIFYQQGPAAALAADQALVDALRADPTALPQDLASVESDVAGGLISAGRVDEAAQLLEESISRLSKSVGARHPLTLQVLVRKADLLGNELKRHAEAIALLADIRDGLRASFGRASRSEGRVAMALGNVYAELEQPERAIAAYTEAEELFNEVHRQPHPDLMAVAMNLGGQYEQTGRLEEAQESFAKALKVVNQAIGPQTPTAAGLQLATGRVAFKRGDYAGASEHLRQALGVARARPSTHLEATILLSRTALAQGQKTEAQELADGAKALLAGMEKPSDNARAAVAELEAALRR